jgi:2-polyprenyl-6-methoxyphenol hydroxylase-like FAD-dependent oxidoreductase
MTLRQTQGRPGIGVIGAGAWGTALAQMLASDGREVLLWARERELVEEINASRSNSLFLPGARLAETIRATAEVADAADCCWSRRRSISARCSPPCRHSRAISCFAPRGSRRARAG